MSALLSVRDLHVDFHTVQGRVRAVQGIGFDVHPGEPVAIVGESGSGKSVTGRAILGLGDDAMEVRGSIEFDGHSLVGMSETALRAVRGRGIGMVFQDALDSLNPVFSVGSQLSEILSVRMGQSRAEARRSAAALLEQVGIARAGERLDDYPHQFSGGMRQRICIAMAIAMRPKLLIADEPTTALDVTVQAEILRLLRRLQAEDEMALMFVTHDLAVARLIARSIIVMYAGQIVEHGSIDEVFENPRHPYTRALLAAHPGWVSSWRELRPIPDDVAVTEELAHDR